MIVLEISVLIFQHNNGAVLHQLVLGEVSAEMDLLVESLEERKITKEEFLKRLSTNTFSGETDHP